MTMRISFGMQIWVWSKFKLGIAFKFSFGMRILMVLNVEVWTSYLALCRGINKLENRSHLHLWLGIRMVHSFTAKVTYLEWQCLYWTRSGWRRRRRKEEERRRKKKSVYHSEAGLYESSRAVNTVGGLPRASSRASIAPSNKCDFWAQKWRFLRICEFVLHGTNFLM